MARWINTGEDPMTNKKLAKDSGSPRPGAGNLNRRKFLQATLALTSGLCLPGTGLAPGFGMAQAVPLRLSEARYYKKLPNRKIQCVLCPRECIIDDLERGYCGVRENRNGIYYTLVHSRPCSVHVDPIEKKPLFHFLPASLAFSLATAGCNVECKFCQNWQISQVRPEQVPALDLPPKRVAEEAQKSGSKSIAYTYTEPVIFTEYMLDSALAANQIGIRSVMISNGYISPGPMKDLCKALAAVKIDLKAFTERFYKELVAGELRPVLDTLVLLRKEKIWFEIVYLIIPGENDNGNELKQMCKWIVTELGVDVPVHFSRFYPEYRLKNLPPTPENTLVMARKIGLDAGLRYVYVGNIPGNEGENTFCWQCGKIVIRRKGFMVLENNLTNGKCKFCQSAIAGVWI